MMQSRHCCCLITSLNVIIGKAMKSRPGIFSAISLPQSLLFVYPRTRCPGVWLHLTVLQYLCRESRCLLLLLFFPSSSFPPSLVVCCRQNPTWKTSNAKSTHQERNLLNQHNEQVQSELRISFSYLAWASVS